MIRRYWLENLGIKGINPGAFCGAWRGGGPARECVSPIDGSVIARIREADAGDYECALGRAREAFLKWRLVPAPRRGQLVRCFGDALRAAKPDLARLVTLRSEEHTSELQSQSN